MKWKLIHHGFLNDETPPFRSTTRRVTTSTVDYNRGTLATEHSTTSLTQEALASLTSDIEEIAVYLTRYLTETLDGQPLMQVYKSLMDYGVVWPEITPILGLFTNPPPKYLRDLQDLGDSYRFTVETVDPVQLSEKFEAALKAALWRTQ